MLARTLGRTIPELLDSMSCREFLEWGRQFGAKPWGLLDVVLHGFGKDAKPKPKKNMVRSPEAMLSVFKTWAEAG